MATERLANSAQTTLTSALDNVTTTVAVASYVQFPGSGNFRIRVDDELMLVTAVSGTTWTVTRGAESTTAAAHSSGAAVVQVLTAAVMNALTALSSDQTANAVLAGPASGGATAPAFRALATADLPDGGVTDAKLRTSTAVSVVGRAAGTSGAPADIAVALASGAGFLTFDDTTDTVAWKQGAGVPVLDGGSVALSNVPLVYGGTGASLSGPGADRVLFWDDSAGQVTWLTVGSGLSISGTTLESTGSGGSVTSVALTVPSFLSVAGSPVTTSGTLAVTLATQNANAVFSGPTSGGAAAPGFRALVSADLPDAGVTYAKMQATGAATVLLGRGAGSGAGAVQEISLGSGLSMSGTTLSATGAGTVTSVGLSAPAFLSVSGSPVTGSGTLALDLATQTANSVMAGPATGSAAAPAFRSLVTGDLPTTVTGALVPTGALMAFAGASAPTGWLACDGSAVSRSGYLALFSVIGTTWGAGDGTTTFNVPDCRRRVPVGSGGTGTGTLGNAVGNTGGAEAHTLTTGEMPSHGHAADAGGIFVLTNGASQNLQINFVAGNNVNINQYSSTATTGGGGAHNNIQPSAVVLYCIKT